MEIQVGAIILQMINFGVVVGALTVLLLKPVRRILEERARKIEEGLKASEAAVAKGSELDKKAKEITLAAQEEGKAIVDEARKDAQERHNEIVAQAKKKSEEIKQKALVDAQSEKDALLSNVHDQFEAAVIAVASKVIGAELSVKQHESLIQAALKEIETA